MPPKKSYLAKLPKNSRAEIEQILEQRDGSLSFAERVAKHWDLDALLQPSAFSTVEDQKRRLDEYRRTLAQRRPDWVPEQVDDFMRLSAVEANLTDVGIARRCALDDPGELGIFLAIDNRLRQAGIGDFERGDGLVTPCATGDIAIARAISSRKPMGFTATVNTSELHNHALQSLLEGNQTAFLWLVERMAAIDPKKTRPWLSGLYAAFQGVARKEPALVAEGLGVHLVGLHKMQQRRELEGAVNLLAHGLVRLLESHSPELLSQFNATQDFPWDAPFHAWVSEHPDPIAGLDFTGMPELIQQIVGRGECPEWLKESRTYLEIVLLGGDVGSRELLEEISQVTEANNAKQAKAMLESCPVVLRWGLDEATSRQYAEGCKARLESKGGQVEIRPMQPADVRWFA